MSHVCDVMVIVLPDRDLCGDEWMADKNLSLSEAKSKQSKYLCLWRWRVAWIIQKLKMMKVPLAIAKEMVCGSNCCEDNFIRTSFTVACLLLPFPTISYQRMWLHMWYSICILGCWWTKKQVALCLKRLCKFHSLCFLTYVKMWECLVISPRIALRFLCCDKKT